MIPCTRSESGCPHPKGDCTGACMEFKPLEPRNLGNVVDVPVKSIDYKAEYEKYRYALKKMAQSNLLWIDLVLNSYKQESIQEAAKKAKADLQKLIIDC